MAAGQDERVFRVLETYPARLFGDDGRSAGQLFGHADIVV